MRQSAGADGRAPRVYAEWFLIREVSRLAAVEFGEGFYVPGAQKLVKGGGQEQGPRSCRPWGRVGCPRFYMVPSPGRVGPGESPGRPRWAGGWRREGKDPVDDRLGAAPEPAVPEQAVYDCGWGLGVSALRGATRMVLALSRR